MAHHLVFPDLLQVRSIGVIFYVLRDVRGLHLIDAGFVGCRLLLRRALQAIGWDREPIKTLIATHGHLDHILNVGRLAAETGAMIAAPRLDAPHYEGQPRYSGAAKVTGWLEALGRPLLGFRKFTPDLLLDDGDALDVWGGLRVVHLPGHTAGHSGWYCESRRLLFSADLFASHTIFPMLPPAIFNMDGEGVRRSVATALALDLTGVLPNHGDRAPPEVHLERLKALGRKITSRTIPQI
jgi:glyoxylase-like metal-dependent hydrolase (beta-lactamase superfamily II)